MKFFKGGERAERLRPFRNLTRLRGVSIELKARRVGSLNEGGRISASRQQNEEEKKLIRIGILLLEGRSLLYIRRLG